MSEVRFTEDTLTQPLAGGRGAVMRSDRMEVCRVHYEEGEGTSRHEHDEEETVFVERGRLEVNLGEETYVVEAGQASFHPAGVSHVLRALEPASIVCFKNILDRSDAGRGL